MISVWQYRPGPEELDYFYLSFQGLWDQLRLALVAVLNCRMDGFFVVAGLLCSSFVGINKGTNRREPFAPLGLEQHRSVQVGNLLCSRRDADMLL